jgi:hypothetical protein
MYTPQFSDRATVTYRRLAWALEVSMPRAVDKVVDALPAIFSPGVICLACKDRTRCALCAFSGQPGAEKSTPAA